MMRSEKHERTILVGDDEPESRQFLEMALRYQGYGVELAEDGQEVLNCLQANQGVSAVLLDLFMPGKNGLDTLREIRSRDWDLPVIMVSGAPAPVNIVEAMKSGATGFLGYPLDHGDLRTALQNAVQGRPEREAAAGRWSPCTREVYAAAAQIGRSEVPVL